MSIALTPCTGPRRSVASICWKLCILRMAAAEERWQKGASTGVDFLLPSKWPRWLHRNILHAPLLQHRSALTSSTHTLNALSLQSIVQETIFQQFGDKFSSTSPEGSGILWIWIWILELKEEAPQQWRMVIKWRIRHWAQALRIREMDWFLWIS